MAASEKLTLDNIDNLSLGELEEVAYALQIDYDPPLTEEQIPKIRGYLEYIIRNHNEFNEDAIVNRREKRRRSRKRSCDDKVTAIMQKDVGLMSDSQLVFLPQIEVVRDKHGIVIDKKIKYICLDRYDDLPTAIARKVNPLNDSPLTDEQLQFLIEQRDNNPYPNISVESFLDEIEERIGMYVPPVIPKHIELGHKLETLLKSQVGDFLKYDLDLIQVFASELSASQYKRFMRYYKVKIQSDNRNGAAIETIQTLINLYNLKDNYETAAIITMTIGDYMTMINKGITYQELVDSGERPEIKWEPSDVKREYYNNDQLKYSVPLREDGLKDGIYESYYSSGEPKVVGKYEKDLQDGVWKTFYKSGVLKTKEEYKDGRKYGEYMGYYNSVPELLRIRGNYENGKPIGLWEELYKDGTPKIEAKYEYGHKNGICKEYHPNGNIRKKEEYDHGIKEGIHEIYYEDETPKLIGSYKGDIKDGVWERYYESGNLKHRVEFKNDAASGISEEYYDVAPKQMKITGEYILGSKDGLWKEYYDTSPYRLKSIESYRGNMLNGVMERYYDVIPKVVRERGEYKYGSKMGPWEEYYETGNLKKLTEWNAGFSSVPRTYSSQHPMSMMNSQGKISFYK